MLTKEELDQINRFSKAELTADQVYTFSVRLCDNEVDRGFERFGTEDLERLGELFLGKSGIFDHQWSAKGQTARIYRTEVVREPGTVTAAGDEYCWLKAWAYLMRTEKNQELITEIEGGIKKEVSVGCSMGRSVCSVCGAENGACGHVKGQMYGEKLCFMELKDPKDAYEWSFVAVPAQRQAGVIKGMQLEQQQGTVQKLWQAAESGQGVWLNKEQVCQLKRMMHNLLEDCEEARRGARRQITRLCSSKGMWDEQASSDLYEVLDLLSIKQMKALGHLLDTEEKRIEQLQTARKKAQGAADGQFII